VEDLREGKLKKKKNQAKPTQNNQELLLFHSCGMQLVHGAQSILQRSKTKRRWFGDWCFQVALQPGMRFCFSGWLATPCSRHSG